MDEIRGTPSVTCEVGSLRLSVWYAGDSTTPSVGTRRRYGYRIDDLTDPGGQAFCAENIKTAADAAVDAEQALRTLAASLYACREPHLVPVEDDAARAFPDWVVHAAEECTDELALVAAHADVDVGTPAGVPRLTDRPERAPGGLVVVEILRHVLHQTDTGQDSGIELDAAGLAELRELVWLADREVSILNPDDPFAMPIFEGSASQAHEHLMPGTYAAHAPDDDKDVVVRITTSRIDGGGVSAALQPPTTEARHLDRISALLAAGRVFPVYALELIDRVITKSGRTGASAGTQARPPRRTARNPLTAPQQPPSTGRDGPSAPSR